MSDSANGAANGAVGGECRDMPSMEVETSIEASLTNLLAASVNDFSDVRTAASASTRAINKAAAQKLQQEREALSVNAQQQLISAAATAEASNPEMSDKLYVNALQVNKNSPWNSTSDVWKSFRTYVGDSRDEFAVCTICKADGKSNWEAEVKYGASHSTSKLAQHISGKHTEAHKRNVEAVVAEERRAGTGLLNSLNVVHGGEAVDKYVEWIALDAKALDTCESPRFRAMVVALNQKSKLGTLTSKTVVEQVRVH